jgi:hypothetical protein
VHATTSRYFRFQRSFSVEEVVMGLDLNFDHNFDRDPDCSSDLKLDFSSVDFNVRPQSESLAWRD